MAYSTMAVANAFVQRAKEGRLPNLTPMKLQKLLFFAQSLHLVRNDNQALFDENFHRWPYGPVIPSLYHEFKEYRANAISDFGGHLIQRDGQSIQIRPIVGDSDTYTWKLIDEIIEKYGKFSGWDLSIMTHREGTAWAVASDDDGGPIENSAMAANINALIDSEH